MNLNNRLFHDEALDAIVQLSLAACVPVLDSLEHGSGREGVVVGTELERNPPVLIAWMRVSR